LLDHIDVTTHAGLRDRALIGLMVYLFARIGAALAMKVEAIGCCAGDTGSAKGAVSLDFSNYIGASGPRI
jgi:hypothetical protein